jgi:hypothetical protein
MIDLDFFTGKDEVELTDELIKKLVNEKKWKDEKSLKQFRDEGFVWNTKRNSLVMFGGAEGIFK